MMTFDPASVAVAGGDFATQVLGQFEPDNDGTWEGTAPDPVRPMEVTEEIPWIEWADAALALAWAGSELAVDWLAVTRIAAPR